MNKTIGKYLNKFLFFRNNAGVVSKIIAVIEWYFLAAVILFCIFWVKL